MLISASYNQSIPSGQITVDLISFLSLISLFGGRTDSSELGEVDGSRARMVGQVEFKLYLICESNVRVEFEYMD